MKKILFFTSMVIIFILCMLLGSASFNYNVGITMVAPFLFPFLGAIQLYNVYGPETVMVVFGILIVAGLVAWNTSDYK